MPDHPKARAVADMTLSERMRACTRRLLAHAFNVQIQGWSTEVALMESRLAQLEGALVEDAVSTLESALQVANERPCKCGSWGCMDGTEACDHCDMWTAAFAEFRAELSAALAEQSGANNCDGCARGLPLNEHGHHAEANGRPYMACTADRYAPSSMWVACSERVPECGQMVQVFSPPNGYQGGISRGFVFNDGEWSVRGVTHWMPLPQPPKVTP